MPAVIHPLRVATILRAAGFSEFREENLLIAALFHDLLEDTEYTETDLEVQANEDVATIVKQLTKPECGSKEDYLEGLAQASREAQIIKLADRIDNLRDMETAGWSAEKRKSYAEQAQIILRTCGGAHPVLKSALQQEIDRVFAE